MHQRSSNFKGSASFRWALNCTQLHLLDGEVWQQSRGAVQAGDELAIFIFSNLAPFGYVFVALHTISAVPFEHHHRKSVLCTKSEDLLMDTGVNAAPGDANGTYGASRPHFSEVGGGGATSPPAQY